MQVGPWSNIFRRSISRFKVLVNVSLFWAKKFKSFLKLAEIINDFDDSIWLIRKIDDSLEAQN